MDPSLIFSLIVLFFCFLGLSWFAGSDAPYVASKQKLFIPILKNLPIKKNKIFFELGSGDGRVVVEAAKLGLQAFGVEQSWISVWYSRFQAQKLNLPNAYFCHGNIFKRSYIHADYIYIYMLQKAVDRLEQKLKKELKKGSIVITQNYHLKTWKHFKKSGNFHLSKT